MDNDVLRLTIYKNDEPVPGTEIEIDRAQFISVFSFTLEEVERWFAQPIKKDSDNGQS